MADQTTAYKTGSVASVSDTTFTANSTSDAFVAGDVGRIIFLTSGDGIRQYRRITGFTSGTVVTVDAPWDVSAFRGLTSLRTNARYAEVAPAANDTYSVSWDWDEMVTNGHFTHSLSNTNQEVYTVNGNFTIQSGVVVYDEDKTLIWNYASHLATSTNTDNFNGNRGIRFGSGFICGRVNYGDVDDSDVIGWPSNPCEIIDVSSANSSENSRRRGTFHMNGGVYNTTGSTTFLRFYENNSETRDATQNFRWWETQVAGNTGGRISGDQSIMYKMRCYNNQSTLFINPIRPAIFLDNEIKGNRQAVYVYPNYAGSTTVEATDIQSLTDRILYFNMGGAGTATTTIKNWSIDQLDSVSSGSTVNLAELTTTASDNTLRFEKDLNVIVSNADGSSFTDDVGEIIFVDTEGTETTDSDDGTGVFPSASLLLKQDASMTNTTINNWNSTALTNYLPYTIAAKYRRHNLITSSNNMEGPIGPISAPLARVVDSNVVDTNANIDNYTDLGTAEKLYDWADKFKYENINLPTPSTQLFTRAVDTVTTTNSSYAVTFDNSATDLIDFSSGETSETLTWDLSGTIPSQDFGIRDSASETDDIPVGDYSAWSTLVGHFFVIRLSTQAASISFLEEAIRAGTLTIDAGSSNSADFDVSGMSVTPVGDNHAAVELGSVSNTSGGPSTGGATDVSYNDPGTITVKSPAAGYVGGIVADSVTFDTEIQGDVTATTINHSFTDGDTIISAGDIDGEMMLSAGTYTISGGDISAATFTRMGTGTVLLDVDSSVTGRGDADLNNVSFVTRLTMNIDNVGTRVSVYDITDDAAITEDNYSDKYVGSASKSVSTNNTDYSISTASGDDEQVTALGDTITKVLIVGSRQGYDTFYEKVDIAGGDNLSVTVATVSNSSYNSTASTSGTLTTSIGTAGDSDGKMVVTTTGVKLSDADTNRTLLELRDHQEYRDIIAINDEDNYEPIFPIGLNDTGVDLARVIFKTAAVGEYVTLNTSNNLNTDSNNFSLSVTDHLTTADTDVTLAVDVRQPSNGVSGDALSAALDGAVEDIQGDDAKDLTEISNEVVEAAFL